MDAHALGYLRQALWTFVHLEGVEPTAHPLELVNVWAEDEPQPSLPVEEALANAPDREAGFFRVPPA